MRMAGQRRMRRRSRAFVEQSLQAACRAVEEERLDSGGHIILLPPPSTVGTPPSLKAIGTSWHRALGPSAHRKARPRGFERRSPDHPITRSPDHPNRLSCLRLMDPLRLTRKLADIESITGNEGAVGAELYELLVRLGYTTHKMPVEHERF